MPPRSVTLLLAIACGVAVSTIYAGQPLLVTIGADLAIDPGTLGVIVTITQVGYGSGLVLLVPLGDLVERRRLIVAQLVLLAAAMLVVAAAGTAAVLLAALAAVGLLAVVVQTVVAHAASMADAASRGRVVGLVTSGVVIGILLARTVSGVLADLAGWRAAYVLWAVALLGVAAAAHRMLVPSSPAPEVRYGALLRSMVRMFVDEPVFRSRALLALLVFAAFSTLWSAIALPLSAPPHGLGHAAIGAFGLAGVAGALAAVPAGRLADRGHAQPTTGVALALLVASWAAIAFAPDSLWVLAIGVVVLDLAVQAVHVSNQSLIVALRPEAGSRLIAGYMVFYSIGSGLGAAAATALYATVGWIGVCVLGATFSALALVSWAVTRRCRTAAVPVRTPADRSAP